MSLLLHFFFSGEIQVPCWIFPDWEDWSSPRTSDNLKRGASRISFGLLTRFRHAYAHFVEVSYTASDHRRFDLRSTKYSITCSALSNIHSSYDTYILIIHSRQSDYWAGSLRECLMAGNGPEDLAQAYWRAESLKWTAVFASSLFIFDFLRLVHSAMQVKLRYWLLSYYPWRAGTLFRICAYPTGDGWQIFAQCGGVREC